MAYRVKIASISTDGTNYFVEMNVFDGEHTFPPVRPVSPADTAAATITAYAQAIANNAPTLPGAIGDLVNTEVVQA